MERHIKADKKYICFPVKTGAELSTAEIRNADGKIFEFKIPSADGGFDYLAAVNIEKYRGKKLNIRGDFPLKWFDGIVLTDCPPKCTAAHPSIHFSPEYGWMNDPNGLVYSDGVYHLYFQYNPFNNEWENMSWGHASSRDLLHWEQSDTVLFPDKHGTIFSGCGIKNTGGCFGLDHDALLFFYTAAGGTNDWSENKLFTQRMAYSTDGGKTLEKYDGCIVDVIGKDSRDPKVFRHDGSGAYIMVLWVRENEFAILRSNNLKDWSISQRLTLESAFECPDLMPLETDDGMEKWIFWCADGYYFIGDFDGYEFQTDGKRYEAYGNKLAYAAQTYSGTDGRTISVPWLRTRNSGQIYRGIMGLPREFSLKNTKDGLRLAQRPVREYEKLKKIELVTEAAECNFTVGEGIPFELLIENIKNITGNVYIGGEKFEITDSEIIFGEEKVSAGGEITDIAFSVDLGIIEVSANDSTVVAAFETEISNDNTHVAAELDEPASIKIFDIKQH